MAKKAADLGQRVLLCEVDKMGGTCVSYGCVPKKVWHNIAHFQHSLDIAQARIKFKNGTVASLMSSRIAQNDVRKIKLFQKNTVETFIKLFNLFSHKCYINY